MKNLKALFTLFSIVLVVISCSKGDEHLSRDLLSPLITIPFDMPANLETLTDKKKLAEFHHYMNLDSLIKANAGSSFGTADIKSIKLTSMRLDVVNFDTIYNFRLVNSLQVKLRNGPDSTELLTQIISNPDVNTETLNLPLASVQPELKTFVNGGDFTYSISGRIRRITAQPFKATLTARYRITIGN